MDSRDCEGELQGQLDAIGSQDMRLLSLDDIGNVDGWAALKEKAVLVRRWLYECK